MSSTRVPCGECGMRVHASEFHPYWYCVLWKAGEAAERLMRESLSGLSDRQFRVGLRAIRQAGPACAGPRSACASAESSVSCLAAHCARRSAALQ